MDSDSGLTDESGNGNDGTLGGDVPRTAGINGEENGAEQKEDGSVENQSHDSSTETQKHVDDDCDEKTKRARLEETKKRGERNRLQETLREMSPQEHRRSTYLESLAAGQLIPSS